MATVTASSVVVPKDVVALTEEHKSLVLATAPILAEHGLSITTEMYRVSGKLPVSES